jgi:hypothetical protein
MVGSLLKNRRWLYFTPLQFIISWINVCLQSTVLNLTSRWLSLSCSCFVFTHVIHCYCASFSSTKLARWYSTHCQLSTDFTTTWSRSLVTTTLAWLNQPTKKLTKGGVLRKRQTSSLARFNHSCVRDALLEMVGAGARIYMRTQTRESSG